MIGTSEAAELLGCCATTLRKAVREGGLPAVRLRPRGNLRFRLADIEAILQAPGRSLSDSVPEDHPGAPAVSPGASGHDPAVGGHPSAGTRSAEGSQESLITESPGRAEGSDG